MFHRFDSNKSSRGFTLLEILLVVAAISILAGIVIIAINPGKQLADTRNAQRRGDVNTVLNAVYQYAIDNGFVPASVLTSGTCNSATHEICKTDGSCTNLIDLSVLTTNQKYIVSIPTDPSGSSNANGTGYFITKNSNGRIIVCAPLAEQSASISVTK